MSHYPRITAPLPPWKHQVAAYDFAYDKPGAMLAMMMGTGKSRVVIDLIQNQDIGKTLIVAPKRVITGHTWATQVQQYGVTPFRVVELGSSPMLERARIMKREIDLWERQGLSRSGRPHLIIQVNYDSIWRKPLDNTILTAGWDLVVLDESHRAKSAGGKASIFLSRLGLVVKKRIALSGTPMAHTPYDVYGQYRFLDRSIFGTQYVAFTNRYKATDITEEDTPICPIHQRRMYHIVEAHYSFWTCNRRMPSGERCAYRPPSRIEYKNLDDLNKRFYRIAYQVSDDVLDLPPYQDIEREFELGPEARKAYVDLDVQLYADVRDGSCTPANAVVKLLRLQQLSGGWITDDERVHLHIDEGKEELLTEILEDIDSDEPIVVFCRFHDDLDSVANAATKAGRTSSELSGRRDELGTWETGATNVLVAQIQAGGVGINTMVRARYCIYYSVGTSLSDYEQSRKRVHRPNQTRPVTYLHLIASNTRDKATYDALQDHRDVVDYVMGTIKKGNDIAASTHPHAENR